MFLPGGSSKKPPLPGQPGPAATPMPMPSSPMAPPPGMPRPGQGIDPMMAMMQGLGPAMPPPPEPPLGPGGLPVGGSMPPGGPGDMGGSPLLAALAGSLGGDPYGVPPGGPDTMFRGIGTGDPQMGLEPMLHLLALAQMGAGGGPASSGIDPGSMGQIGQMVGY